MNGELCHIGSSGGGSTTVQLHTLHATADMLVTLEGSQLL